jgi:hypothetical protein
LAHSVGANARRISPIVTQIVSAERAAALRNKCLSLAKTRSIGFRSGEYFGRKKSLGPGCADELAHRFGFVTTEIVHDHMSPGRSVGTRTFST